ncbi:MAG: signal recognition particle-docking protein FtsY, partial [Thermoplasmata archaeon]
KHRDFVLIDTAGRMQTNVNLMDEMTKIKRVAKPDMVIFVGDALAGNDAVEQARKFDEAVGIDGIILTKVDADAKGGSALSIAYTIGKPLLFIGIGQDYEDQIPFDPDWMINRIFGEESD